MSSEVIELIARIADHLPSSDGLAVVAQAHRATVVGEVAGRSVDVTVQPDSGPLSLPDGPIRPIPAVITDGQPVGEVIVWVRSGYLIGVEQPWFGDEPPDTWPKVDSLAFD